jgi:UPF0755 protein
MGGNPTGAPETEPEEEVSPPEILPPGYAGQDEWRRPRHRRRAADDRGDGGDAGAAGEGGDPDASEDGHHHRREGQAHRSHPVLWTLLILATVVVLIAVGLFVWAQHQINPGGHRGPDVAVDIPAGSSTSRIGSILARAGVIHEGTLFAWYVRLKGDGPLLPGNYSLPKNSSYQSAITALENGPKILTDRLLIPEGFTVRQIAAAVGGLPGLHLSAARFLAAAEGGEVRSPYEPAGVNNLEGLLFPATYQVRQGETEIDVLEQMVGAFDGQAAALGLAAASAHLHLTPYQVVTVASIVEREAKLAVDRGPVASTLYNRLRVGMPLGADSTETYFLRLTHPSLVPSAAQLNQPSRYNTRLHPGLPPTPIANPGLASLQAAAHPPGTHYLYFVEVKPDGTLGFASTAAGFAQLQNQCQAAKLC